MQNKRQFKLRLKVDSTPVHGHGTRTRIINDQQAMQHAYSVARFCTEISSSPHRNKAIQQKPKKK